MVNHNEGKSWSDNDFQQLKVLITENTPTRLIAKLGRTEGAIRSKVEAEGLSLAPANRNRRD